MDARHVGRRQGQVVLLQPSDLDDILVEGEFPFLFDALGAHYQVNHGRRTLYSRIGEGLIIP